MSLPFTFSLHRQNMHKYDLLASINAGTLMHFKLLKLYHDRGFATTCDDRVLAFGENSKGLLGLGHSNPILSTNELTSLRGKGVVEFACGPKTNLVRTNEGKVFQFGGLHKTPRLIIDCVVVVEINCTCQFWSLALTNTGVILTWSDSSPVTKIESVSGIVQIDSGLYHSIARDVGGKVWTWGSNAYRQLGLIDRKTWIQQPETLKTYKPIKQIVCGALHTIYLNTNGQLFITGHGRTLRMSSTPVEFDKPVNFQNLFMISYQLACDKDKNVLFLGLTDNDKALVWLEADKPLVTSYQQVDHEQLLKLLHKHSKYCLIPGMILIDSDKSAKSNELTLASPILDPSIRGNIILAKKLSSLFDKAENYDIIFEFSDKQTIHAHRVMLMIGSTYLSRMLDTKWKNENPIMIDSYTYNVYYRYLKYFYTNQLEPVTLLEDKVNMYELVLEEDLEELIDMCQLEIINALTIDNCQQAFHLAKEKNLQMLTRQISNFIDDKLKENI